MMAPDSNDIQQLTTLPDKIQEQVLDVTDTGSKVATRRHPRWTKGETFVLIEGKKVVENRVNRGRRSISAFGADQIESKWDSISSYCKQHGVNRGSVQCRKRWSNLLGDFKKIITWESQRKDGDDTFWSMRNELRRERKLPSFFDREVFCIMSGKPFATEAIPLTLITVKTEMNTADGDKVAVAATAAEEEEEEEEEAEAVFDSGQHARADGLFSDFKQSGQDEVCCSSKKKMVTTEDPRRMQPVSGNQMSSLL